MIQVVNQHWYKGHGVYIGRPSPLGNPFSHLSNTQAAYRVPSREAAIACYESWLDQVLVDPQHPATQELKRLATYYQRHGTLTLICWCKPAACHGDVLARRIRLLVEGPDGYTPQEGA